jgi:hypothetical protein
MSNGTQERRSYSLCRGNALTRYTSDGLLDIVNNAVEHALRPLAIGRRNGSFAGFNIRGERAATLETIIETAKLNGLDLGEPI